jgi:hypothetical protein
MNHNKPVHYEDINDRPGAPSLCGNKDRSSIVCADPAQVTCDICLEKFNSIADNSEEKPKEEE